MGERRGAYRALVGKPEGRRPLGRPRRRWEDNIKIDLLEVVWGWGGGVDSVDLAQDREPMAGSCVYGDEPSGCIKYGDLTEINIDIDKYKYR
jgi:hypothetical protein